MKRHAEIISKPIPEMIARQRLHPANKPLIVWMIMNGYDLRQPLSLHPDLRAVQAKLSDFAPQRDSYVVWNFSLFFGDFASYRFGEKTFDKKELKMLRAIYLKPETAHVRYLRYRPD